MFTGLSRVYPLIGLLSGYVIVLLFNPVRVPLRDGFRCLLRYKRVWLTFVLLGFAYFVFQFSTFTPIQSTADFDLTQITSLANWHWPTFMEVWQEAPIPALEGVAGIFDNATTTYPLSAIAAVLMLINWRGLHGALVRALHKRFRVWGYPVYLILLLSAVSALLKPIVFWALPLWGGLLPAAGLLQISASVDAVAFIFEYLFGVYIQIYLIAVCFAWIRGLSFEEGELFRFGMRRFSYVLEWAGIVVLVSTLIVRLPLLLAYFVNVPDVLDYLPIERAAMCGLIIAFSSVQISLALHNETLREAIRAHREFLRNNLNRFGWFLLICGIHFFFLTVADAIVRGAIADRLMAMIIWKSIFVFLRGLITGWLLASWWCFCLVIDHIADGVDLSVEEKRRRLREWRDWIRTARPNESSFADDVRNLIAKYALTPEMLEEIIAGVEMDLSIKRYQTFEELRVYCYRVASAVGLVSIEIFGYRNSSCKEYAVQLGIALQMTNIIRDVGKDLQAGRIYLPQEDLARCNYSETELQNRQYNERFVRLMEFEAARAREFFSRAAAALPLEDRRTMVPAEIMGSIYRGLLSRMELDKFRVFEKEYRLTGLEKARRIAAQLLKSF